MDSTNNGSIIKIHCDYYELMGIFYGCDVSNIEIIPNTYFNTQQNAIVLLDRNQWEYFYEVFKHNDIEFRRICDMWEKNNNLVVFWKCHFEPMVNKIELDFILKKWQFKYLTITDLEIL